MKMISGDLEQMCIVDKIFLEPNNLCTSNMSELCIQIRDNIAYFCEKYRATSGKSIMKSRYNRFRKF